ncbi:tripartite tricarboxylate transporter substrate binding protein [Orrella sp. JC864]|uniref:tripartite tricarboxylate transporter substrate binding protein n=1 Tax=Orrella sp. JC864 TaxID=3120298 RepID=UPI00300AC10B
MKKLFVTALFAVLPTLVAAQQPPKGAMTIVNPFTVSGLTDLVARMVAEKSHARFPNGVAVVSRPGAGGTIGITSVVTARPDGTTIGFTPTGAVVDAPQMMSGLMYQTPDDIAPIINVFSSYQMLAVRGDAPWKTPQQFIEAVRQSPGKYSMGHTGTGTASHLNMAQLVQAAELDLLEVPYKGWAQSSIALLGGQVDAIVINAGEGRALIDDGRMRILAVFQSERVPFHPDVPTFKEAGHDVGIGLKFFFFGPRNMDAGVKQYIHDAFKEAMQHEEFRQFLASREVELDYMDGEQTKKMLWSEFKQHTALLASLGLLAK